MLRETMGIRISGQYGDFGRTPKVNKKGGRDHWSRLCTCAFAGGGLPGGAVIGAADRQER